MEQALARSGIRTHSILVDVTNYVLLELGQPMHAFDLAKIEGTIQVRQAQPQEKLVLLNDQEVELQEDIMVIADQQKFWQSLELWGLGFLSYRRYAGYFP